MVNQLTNAAIAVAYVAAASAALTWMYKSITSQLDKNVRETIQRDRQMAGFGPSRRADGGGSPIKPTAKDHLKGLANG